MWRLLRVILYLAIIGALALIAYAYAGPIFFPGDFAPPRSETSVPITLEPSN